MVFEPLSPLGIDNCTRPFGRAGNRNLDDAVINGRNFNLSLIIVTFTLTLTVTVTVAVTVTETVSVMVSQNNNPILQAMERHLSGQNIRAFTEITLCLVQNLINPNPF